MQVTQLAMSSPSKIPIGHTRYFSRKGSARKQAYELDSGAFDQVKARSSPAGKHTALRLKFEGMKMTP